MHLIQVFWKSNCHQLSSPWFHMIVYDVYAIQNFTLIKSN